MIPVAEARDWVGAESKDDNVLAVLINYATAHLGRALGYYLGPPTEQLEIKCGKGTSLTLDQDPVVDDDGNVDLVIFTRYRTSDPWTLIDAGAYEVVNRTVTRITGYWPIGTGTVKVVYDAGFAVGKGPAQLRDLVRDLVALKWGQRGGQLGVEQGMKSESLGDYSYTRGDVEQLGSWNETVKSWRRMLA